jgi:hypothetical protein
MQTEISDQQKRPTATTDGIAEYARPDTVPDGGGRSAVLAVCGTPAAADRFNFWIVTADATRIAPRHGEKVRM